MRNLSSCKSMFACRSYRREYLHPFRGANALSSFLPTDSSLSNSIHAFTHTTSGFSCNYSATSILEALMLRSGNTEVSAIARSQLSGRYSRSMRATESVDPIDMIISIELDTFGPQTLLSDMDWGRTRQMQENQRTRNGKPQ
jgi:hypothetical protein